VRSRWLLSLLKRFEFAAYRGASRAIVLCPAFARALVACGYPSDRIHLIRSPTDVARIGPHVNGGDGFRDRHGLGQDDFVILCSGSMGLKQGLANVVRAAAQLKEHSAIRWVLIGDGETRPELEELVRGDRLEDVVKLLPFAPEPDVGRMLAAANVLLLNQLQAVKDAVIPSKLLMYMAAGKPVLAAVNRESEAATLLVETGGGLLVTPENPTELAAAALRLFQEHSETLEAMGQRNRQHAEQHFDERVVVRRQMDVITSTVVLSAST
jgi:colanic acid biosynthesis glycosyl transferase WcaI